MEIQKINDEEFDTLVLDAKKPVLVKFTAKWCRPCKALNPILISLMKSHPQVEFYEIDIEQNPFLAEDYNVKSLPTIIIFKDGVVDGRVSGVVREKILNSVLFKYRKRRKRRRK